ncbi:MAG: nucleotidyltransferase family protein, partial [Thermomicrobiales bacterium]|nr:nucleotidyltransferase family protein [Thermomicrobiales bacterium]
MVTTAIELPLQEIAEICERHRVAELSLFGSVLRDDFRPDSDVDVMVTFFTDAQISLFDLVDLQDDLKQLFGRDVDVITRNGIERSKNYIRKAAILDTARV